MYGIAVVEILAQGTCLFESVEEIDELEIGEFVPEIGWESGP